MNILSSCWMDSPLAFYGAVIFPIAVSLLYNIVVLMLVVKSLRKGVESVGQVVQRRKTTSAAFLLRTIVYLSMLLGMTWTAGILVVVYDHVVTQYIFTVLNTAQGVMIFLYASRDKEMRRVWLDRLSKLPGGRRRRARNNLAAGGHGGKPKVYVHHGHSSWRRKKNDILQDQFGSNIALHPNTNVESAVDGAQRNVCKRCSMSPSVVTA
eukprot:scpid104370/ scgid2208/ G-protein coupled receptor 64; Mouse epididymis-specific protein 6